MAIISFYGRKIIFGHFILIYDLVPNWHLLLVVFVGFFGGKRYKNGLFGATTRREGTYGIMTVGLGSQICLNIPISLYFIFSIFALHFT